MLVEIWNYFHLNLEDIILQRFMFARKQKSGMMAVGDKKCVVVEIG